MADQKTSEQKYEDGDFGPAEIGAMLGVCIGLYINHDVSRESLVEMVGDMYDDIAKLAAEHKKAAEVEAKFYGDKH